MKGISTIIATIVLLLITISLAGTAYMFFSGVFTGKTATAFSILDFSGRTIIIRNDGTNEISSMTAIVDGQPVSVAFPQGSIQPGSVGNIQLEGLPPTGGRHNFKLISTSMGIGGVIDYSSLGNFVGYGSKLFFYTPQSTNIAVFATTDNTEVKLFYDGSEKNSFVINSGYFNTFSNTPSGKYVRIESNSPVAAIAYYYCCGWNKYGLTAVPSADTKKAIGKLFYSYSGDFKIISYGNGNQISIIHSGGTTPVTLDDGDYYSGSFNSASNTAGQAIKITSTQPIVVLLGGESYNYGSYVPSGDGSMRGNKFRGWTRSYFTMVSYEDGNGITAKNLANDATIGSWNLNKKQFQRISFNGWYEVTSTKSISVMSDSPQSCNAGDDAHSIYLSRNGNVIYWVGSRTYAYALADDTQITVDGGAPLSLDKFSGTQITSTEGVHEISTDKEILLVAYSVQGGCGGWSWDDWHTFLPAIH